MKANINRKFAIIATIGLACVISVILVACGSKAGSDDDEAVQPKAIAATRGTTAETEATTTKTTTEVSTTSEPEIETKTTETVTTTEVITTSEPETTPTDESKHEIATTPVESMPENGELLSVEECLKKLISEKVGADVAITNIECNELEGDMIIYLDNGMEIGTTNVASHYAAGDKTSIDNYEIDKDTAYDYFILYWG
ncbi:MAG: hypothetical protein J5881_03270 [Clostridia bacterium]|nr:hypothetical protein [Clostridia bacterium]